ncbi:uncharacterized protein LOC127565575 [Drosophila albomicans]|uniref:Uncharacterized protein LOC127565575 n=1 Tax=Drosophila albomicans TaxID=7291 RepID=A0A9C6T3D0_DROAB|nr:uncharacterized protein LOC127565575 [Drosophila albomicans]
MLVTFSRALKSQTSERGKRGETGRPGGRTKESTGAATSFGAFVRARPDMPRMCVFVVITFKLAPMPYLMPLAGSQIPDADTMFPPNFRRPLDCDCCQLQEHSQDTNQQQPKLTALGWGSRDTIRQVICRLCLLRAKGSRTLYSQTLSPPTQANRPTTQPP